MWTSTHYPTYSVSQSVIRLHLNTQQRFPGQTSAFSSAWLAAISFLSTRCNRNFVLAEGKLISSN